MQSQVKLTTIGNSVGIILSKELLQELNVEKGETLFVTRTPEGIQLTPYDAEFAEQMKIARKVMKMTGMCYEGSPSNARSPAGFCAPLSWPFIESNWPSMAAPTASGTSRCWIPLWTGRRTSACEENATIFRLAAPYAFGIAHNHAFLDGNKRTALVVCRTFLYANGWTLHSSKEELSLTFLHLAELSGGRFGHMACAARPPARASAVSFFLVRSNPMTSPSS